MPPELVGLLVTTAVEVGRRLGVEPVSRFAPDVAVKVELGDGTAWDLGACIAAAVDHLFPAEAPPDPAARPDA